MKKLITLVLSLICLLGFVGCSNTSIHGIDKATKIEIIQYDISSHKEMNTTTITEDTKIKHIIDNLNSLKLKKMDYNEPTVREYKLTFYNTDGEMIEKISIPVHGWIEYNGYFHSIADGELDRTYLAGLFTTTK